MSLPPPAKDSARTEQSVLRALGAVLSQSQRDMLGALNHHYPVYLTRREMMRVGRFFEHVQGKLGAYACFEWAVLRLQDALRPHGWAVDDRCELYVLIKI